ncbi:magnesium transporter [Pseudobutyrivibrio xylanivorans]|uniref:Magnesium transporter MgtE n=1 Tax=Pseudobutyrivibrio xylanivorans DSM 14809 TaxID=1123012 RepID=A0A1M6CR40_PSEXY|nr:magnesium transporter [Pseudobutyrivibrio xylanivorans]SHI63545.1 magnesium transporter [Pseudobutyrivibrio xylanivorans DSM 14809]
METKDLLEDNKIQEIIDLLRSDMSAEQMIEALDDYHENDIAEAYESLETEDRQRLFGILGAELLSEIFPYIEDVGEYLTEITPEQAADVLENMDADDAVDALEDIDDEEQREKLIELMDEDASADVRLINSYDEDEIGSMMTTNFIVIEEDFSVKQAMRSLISQSQDNDNINTIYVVDKEQKYCGAIELRDLILARADTPLADIISHSYPSVQADASISDSIEMLKDYAEDSIPVLNPNDEIIGVITAQDIIEAVDDEMGEDYAKLAGLTAEEDLNESLLESIKKRIPWLLLLLGLGLLTSSVIGIFEGVVASVAVVVVFQSLILDMAGNVGTQSLAVTIRVLMDEEISGVEKAKFVLKEMRVGGTNGLILGLLAFVFVAVYLHGFKAYVWYAAFSVSGIVGFSLFVAMIVSSFIGTIIPIFFHKIKVDPAVASGPLITTVNDLVAVVTYYGLAGLLLVGRL